MAAEISDPGPSRSAGAVWSPALPGSAGPVRTPLQGWMSNHAGTRLSIEVDAKNFHVVEATPRQATNRQQDHADFRIC